jgi:hypothetical protein
VYQCQISFCIFYLFLSYSAVQKCFH